MPSREMRSGVARVSSWPRKKTRPEVARNSPESRLRKVDLPAPLGPITAWTRPSAKERETPSTAASAPKRRERSRVSSSASGTARLEQARHPSGQKENDGDDHRADDGRPMLGETLTLLLQERQQKRAQRRTVERSFAAEEHRHQDQPGLAPAEEGGIDEPVQVCVEISGQTGERSGQDEGREQVLPRRKSERAHPLLVAADADEHPAEGRAEQEEEKREDGDERDPDGIVSGDGIAQ